MADDVRFGQWKFGEVYELLIENGLLMGISRWGWSVAYKSGGNGMVRRATGPNGKAAAKLAEDWLPVAS